MRGFTTWAVLVLVLAGCADDGFTGPGEDGSPTVASQDAAIETSDPRPLIGRCETEFEGIPVPGVPHIITGTCQLAHLGRTTLFLNQVISFATGTIVSQELTFTAANGDILRAEESGTFAPNGPTAVTFNGTFTFVGGTGRFADATGTASFSGGAEFVTSTGFFTLDGQIGFDASGH